MVNKEILKGYMLFKTGFPDKLFGEAIRIYKTAEEAETAKDGYVHSHAKFLIVLPVKLTNEI